MVLFKDVHKRADTLLNKDWCHDKAGIIENNWKKDGCAFKNKTVLNSMASPCCKPPVTTTEISHECRSASVIARVDTEGRSGFELKLKDLAQGLLVHKKFNLTKAGNTAEIICEYAYPKGDCGLHTSLSVVPIGVKQTFAASATTCAAKGLLVGAEVTGALAMKDFKYALGTGYSHADSGTFVGARVGQDLTSLKVCLTGFVQVARANQEVAVSAGATNIGGCAKTGKACTATPQLTLAAKHNFNKNTWAKASVTESLGLRAMLSHRVSSLFSVQVGVSVEGNANNPAATMQIGTKFLFNCDCPSAAVCDTTATCPVSHKGPLAAAGTTAPVYGRARA